MHPSALAELLRAAHATVVLTGAGIATESGIPDFRGPDGLWSDPAIARLAYIDTFRQEPAAVWEFYARRFAGVRAAEPNAGHRAIVALERGGLVDGLITQNIDGLHRRAGSRPIEVHGSLELARCLACTRTVPFDEALARRARDPEGVPRCACGAVLKPGVVMFGEALPADAIEAAFTAVEDCDLLIAAGTSLEVHPVAGLVDVAKASGARVAILNREPTPYDAVADLVERRPLGEVLPEAVRLLDAG